MEKTEKKIVEQKTLTEAELREARDAKLAAYTKQFCEQHPRVIDELGK